MENESRCVSLLFPFSNNARDYTVSVDAAENSKSCCKACCDMNRHILG